MEELKLKPVAHEISSIFKDVDDTFKLYYNNNKYVVPCKCISTMIFRPYTDVFKRKVKAKYNLGYLPERNLFLKISLPLSIMSSLPSPNDISKALDNLSLNNLSTQNIINTTVSIATMTATEISSYLFPLIICVQQTDLDNEEIYFNFDAISDDEKKDLLEFGDDGNYMA